MAARVNDSIQSTVTISAAANFPELCHVWCEVQREKVGGTAQMTREYPCILEHTGGTHTCSSVTTRHVAVCTQPCLPPYCHPHLHPRPSKINVVCLGLLGSRRNQEAHHPMASVGPSTSLAEPGALPSKGRESHRWPSHEGCVDMLVQPCPTEESSDALTRTHAHPTRGCQGGCFD